MEANAKLYILKHNDIPIQESPDTSTALFTGNSADYGGAVYVDDDSISGTCVSDPNKECFFQVLALYDFYPYNVFEAKSMYFSQNNANFSGSTLYGGLLDRCAVSPFAEVYKR